MKNNLDAEQIMDILKKHKRNDFYFYYNFDKVASEINSVLLDNVEKVNLSVYERRKRLS